MNQTIVLTGDTIIMRGGLATSLPGSAELRNLIADADAAFTNLECLPADYAGHPDKQSGGAHFGAPSWLLDELTGFGFNLFGAANNHSLNYGVAGLRALMAQLDRRALHYAGIGENLAEARMPAYLDTAHGSIGLVACSSTFGIGHQASEQRPDLQGRPGLSPLAFDTTHVVTPEQLRALQGISSDLGLDARLEREIKLGFAFLNRNLDDVSFLDGQFRAGRTPHIETSCAPSDLDDIVKWVREARRRSDIVIASIHTHEQGETLTDPAQFVREFAAACIEAGAAAVVGHGPHFLRPLEFHRGRPIFYSLGNFIGQNELVAKLPADSYTEFRVPPHETPSVVFDTRTKNDQKGFPSEERYWETVVPRLRFSDRKLESIDIHPVTLDLGQPPQRRGRPRLAHGEDGAAILKRFARLCEAYDTKCTIEQNVMQVALPCWE